MSARAIFHLIAMSLHFYGLWYDYNYVHFPNKPKNDIEFLRGRVKYLTAWNLLLQALFFTICFVNDIIGNNENFPKKAPLIRRIKDLVLPALAFPLAMFVGITFWGIYLIDRELIFPKALDPYFPNWLNHVMHTNIMLFILIEMYSAHRKYPTRKLGISILSVFMLAYLVWIIIINVYSGIWVYPILEVLNLPLRTVFFASMLVLTISLYIAGEKLNAVLWRKAPISKKVK